MIEIKNLHKCFGNRVAVNGVSFVVRKGEVLGFLGPNGAGKSTTMRMITGFLLPTSGSVLVGGIDVSRKPIKVQRMLGYLPENAPVYPDMTVSGFLDFIAEIRGLYGRKKTFMVDKIIDNCFLNGVRQQVINTLSKGFKQRVCFAQSIIHDPEYLVMDEPTDGLDPNQKHEVRSMIKKMSGKKVIILSSHNLEEVDAVCTRAIIISEGTIVVDDTPDGIRQRSKIHGAVVVSLSITEKEKFISAMGNLHYSPEILYSDNKELTFRLKVNSEENNAILIRQMVDSGVNFTGINIEKGRLDEVFRSVTTGGNA